MLPAIPLGTTLQNRYRLLSILGQGGFGRTYLAEDLGRFNERCALKEFIPQTNNPYAIAKSKELFMREASALYQIQHPQIPQFRAIFEENQRLFILQDYVEGKTYHTILDERKASGDKFTELDVLNFNKQLLPVLSYLHSRNMIHRDISPDNIILRDTDQMPVLIDFGVVKELVTQATTGTTTAAATATTVGKVGFSPPEQMQTGKVNPNSDFYALAVTSLVMLTGKEPSELLDQTNLTWDWQKWANVSPGFATILDKMLSHKPGDRYQSANEILQAINQLGGNNPTVTSVPPTLNNIPSVQPDNSSSIGTVVVGRRPDSQQNIDLEESEDDDDRAVGFWDSKAAIVGVSSLVVILLGLGSWGLVSSILKGLRKKSEDQKPELVSPSPSPSPSPILTITPSPTLSPTIKPTSSPGTPTPSPSPGQTTSPPIIITPAPEPIPPIYEPEPELPPMPELEPSPIPDPIPELPPLPEPEPAPIPAPIPDPIYEPEPAPIPEPAPDPMPEPAPIPEPEPSPAPIPAPSPVPEETTPEPPIEEPVESPAPTITPSPVPEETTPANTNPIQQNDDELMTE